MEFAPNLIDLCVEVERTQSAKDKKTDSIKQLVSKRIRMFGTLLGLQKPVDNVSSKKERSETNDKKLPDFTNDPPSLNTKRSMLSTHEIHMGHDEDDEVDMSFPEDAHTGPLVLDHLASVHNLKLHDVSLSPIDEDSDSKIKESASRSGTHAIDIESKESAEGSLLKGNSKSGSFVWYNPMTWCNKNDGNVSEPPEFIDTPFYQQTQPAKQIFVTARGSAISYFIIGSMLLILGGILYDAAETVVFMDTSYSGRMKGEEGNYGDGKAFYAHTDCGNNTLKESYNDTTKWYNVREGATCEIKMRIPFKMKAPIAVYYRLTDFYQNYNSYFSSRDSLQLMGTNSDAKSCAAVNVKYNRIGFTEDQCDPTDPGCEYLFPCGLVSNTMFNDTFELITQSSSSSCTCATASADQIPDKFDCNECQTWPKSSVSLRTDSIYWSSDDDFFKAYVDVGADRSYLSILHTHTHTHNTNRYDGYGSETNVSYLSETYSSTLIDTSKQNGMRDPRYLVWMRPAAQPDFKKIYAKIDEDIPANSEVTFTVTSRFPAFFYGGSKHIILASVNWQGPSKSYIMAWIFLGFGIYTVTMSLAIAYKIASCPRKPGTEGYVGTVANNEEFIPEKDDWAIKNIVSGVAQSAVTGMSGFIRGEKKDSSKTSDDE